jgi:hypothetical protein
MGMKKTKYPNIVIPMVGEDGNAFAILGRIKRIMEREGLPDSEWKAFHAEATQSDYDNLLRTVMGWFSVDIRFTSPDDEVVSIQLKYADAQGNEVCPIHRDASVMNGDGTCAECLDDAHEATL